MQSPAGQKHRQLVDGGFPLDGEAVVGLQAVHVSFTTRHDLRELRARHAELVEHGLVQVLEVPLERHAAQPVGHVHHLRQARAEEREAPQERVRGARVRPGPQRGAEEAQREQREQVEESVEAAAAHEAQHEEDVRQVEHGALRAAAPLRAQRVRRRRLRHREVHGFDVRRLHVEVASNDPQRSSRSSRKFQL